MPELSDTRLLNTVTLGVVQRPVADSVVMEEADGGAGPGARPGWRWDVALSFAGAQRDYVEQVAQTLQARGVRCFYDADEQIELWGKSLAEELPLIYGEQAAAVVVFVSADYAARDWTRLERRAALARAVRERREYVLPARFDDTSLPGLPSDMVTVDLRNRTPQQFAAMIAGKLAALGIAAPPTGAGGPARNVEVDLAPLPASEAAWHLPGNSEPRGNAGMRDPVFPTDPVPAVTVFSGHQFQGGGNAVNQLQDGSALLFKRTTDAAWQTVPLIFATAIGSNTYYSGEIPTGAFPAGTIVQYYLRIAYDDHATTFLQAAADDMTSVTTGEETAAQAAPFTFTIETPDKRGKWGKPFRLPNVGIHAHMLPNGLVLMWGRRDNPNQSLDTDTPSRLQPGAPPAPPATCTPFLLNPATGVVVPTPRPMHGNPAINANLFCSGHAFLPDGRLLVAGGHLADRLGLDQATIYDPVFGTWTPTALMNHGRWCPTALSLADGSVLVLSGSIQPATATTQGFIDLVPQVWSNGRWTSIMQMPAGASDDADTGGPTDLDPRLHVASTGLVWMTSLTQTWTLDISNGGKWTAVPNVKRINGFRDCAPSVLYDLDRVIFIGGGNPPTANAEIIDLSQAQPAWQATGPMHFPRRQHNATILPDGTVLVTGGTRSGGSGPPQNFNNLDPGQPVHIAELWNPTTGQWTQLAAEQTDRCYHSTAVLLPDATVLSAGSGEFFPIEGKKQQNDPQDSHRDAQVFSPPYLFRGDRPVITSAPALVHYGDEFEVGTAQSADILHVSWIRLSCVTRSFNANQRLTFLSHHAGARSLKVTAPATPNICPPGHYMLFILNRQGVPSTAAIVQIAATAA